MPIGRLHVLTDYHFQQRFSHAELARLVIDGGAEVVQFRQKHGMMQHKLRQAHATADVCQEKGIPLLIDDHIDMCFATGADGVHLGQTDFPITEARRVLGPDAIIGATATNVKQAVRAADEGATYIGFGPVFTTRSKKDPAKVKGLQGLAEACQAVAIPVIAIAGITPSRVAPVMEAGAHGVAVMTGITTKANPQEATRHYRRELDAVLAA